MRRRAVTTLGALLAALLAACGTPAAGPSAGSVESHNVITAAAAGSDGTAGPPTAAPALPARVAIRVHTPSESTSTLPITVAQRLGYYEQEGIDLEQQPMPPNVGMAALLSGDV